MASIAIKNCDHVIRGSRVAMKFQVGDVVTIHSQLSARSGLRGTVVEISDDPADSMPLLVEFEGDWGRHRFGPDELTLAERAPKTMNSNPES
jgi:hypothetical protein